MSFSKDSPLPRASSSSQLARSLVNMHNQVAQGNYEYVHQLQATPAGAAAASQKAQVGGVDACGVLW